VSYFTPENPSKRFKPTLTRARLDLGNQRARAAFAIAAANYSSLATAVVDPKRFHKAMNSSSVQAGATTISPMQTIDAGRLRTIRQVGGWENNNLDPPHQR